MGLEVDFINSVQFCNHTGYKSIKGQRLTDTDLKDLMQGLADNDLDSSYSHLLTGYIGTSSFLSQICNIVKTLKHKNPNLIYGKVITTFSHLIILYLISQYVLKH